MRGLTRDEIKAKINDALNDLDYAENVLHDEALAREALEALDDAEDKLKTFDIFEEICTEQTRILERNVEIAMYNKEILFSRYQVAAAEYDKAIDALNAYTGKKGV